MAQAAEWKKDQVAELVKMLDEHSVIGIVGVEGIPGPQIQSMRKRLRDRDMGLKVAKLKLLELALDQSDQTGIAALKEHLDGQAGLVVSKGNPFSLYKELQGTLTKSPAKGGEKAPFDIIVPKGETPFKPGPIVGEFQKVGLPAAIEKGKVVIKKDTTLVAEGDVITRDQAQMLTKLEIYPLTVGLNLHAAFEGGEVFSPKVLHIDLDEFLARLQRAYLQALGLGVASGYATGATIRLLLARAARESRGLSLGAAIPTKATIGALLAKAQCDLLAVAGLSPDLQSERITSLLSSAPVAAAPVPADAADASGPSEKEDDDEDEASEEDAAAGLGALFG